MNEIPNIVARLYAERNWPMLIYYFRGCWNEQSWLYLKRNGNAVKRIKDEFTRLTGRPAYSPATNAKHWDQEIAKYAERLGVAALIDDMRLAVAKYEPKSIIYFLHASGACRWEMLLMDKIQEEIRQRQHEDNSAYADMAKLFPSVVVKKVEPEWVAVAKKRRQQIAIIMQNYLNTETAAMPLSEMRDLKIELERINQNLTKFGYAE